MVRAERIQDADVEAVRLVTKKFGKALNLEMGPSNEIVEVALATLPDWICLVPENRQELTTEGGLNLLDPLVFTKVQDICNQLRGGIENVKISLFLAAQEEILAKAFELDPDAVEIHTGEFARAHMDGEEH